MGGGSSVVSNIPLRMAYHSLPPEEQEKLRLEFEALKASGKTEEEAFAILEKKVTPEINRRWSLIPPKRNSTSSEIQTNPPLELVMKIELTELESTIKNSVANGKTPLIIDNSPDDKVN